MSIERRVRQLEGPAHATDGDKPDLIFIVGIEPIVAGGGTGDTTASMNMRPSTDEPQNFLAYCLHPQCEAREHASLDGETLEQMQSRLILEHKGLPS